jgi:hypothetical protein
MSRQVIIYPNDSGGITLLYPSGLYSTENTALKDVPFGKPFRIINTEQLPTDPFAHLPIGSPDRIDYFPAWTADFSKPDGIGRRGKFQPALQKRT